jgi:protein ImuB
LPDEQVHVMSVRTLVVWCPDWPVIAAHAEGLAIGPEEPAAVLRANRVVACSASARAGGIHRGMRRREAQGRVPSVELIADDPSRDARWFEPVIAAIEHFTPLIEIVRPGLCQFATRGPSRYFGGDQALVGQVQAALRAIGTDARLGIADGPFAASLAARIGGAENVTIVEPGESPTFLSTHPITSLLSSGAERLGDAAAHRRAGRSTRTSARAQRIDHPDDLSSLIELWDLLGLRTLGMIAALERADVLARFGNLGLHAHRLASGHDEMPLDPTPIPADLAASMELDPPIDRVEAAAFVAKGLAEELHQRLLENGLACTRIKIEAHTGSGVQLTRLWRHERSGAAGGITAQGLADRIRWQLDGWLRRLAEELRPDIRTRATVVLPQEDEGPDPTADWDGSGRCLVRIVVAPDEVHADAGRQLGFWGGGSDADARAGRVFTRIQGMLGPDAVQVVVPSGGRAVSEAVRLVPWGDDTSEQLRDGLEPSTDRPWPGRVPAPMPSIVHTPPLPADVRNEEGWPVKVSGRGELSAPPARVSVARSVMGSLGSSSPITGWAGPWPIEERWWDPAAARRRARLQVVTNTGRAYLLLLEGGDWWVEATYD